MKAFWKALWWPTGVVLSGVISTWTTAWAKHVSPGAALKTVLTVGVPLWLVALLLAMVLFVPRSSGRIKAILAATKRPMEPKHHSYTSDIIFKVFWRWIWDDRGRIAYVTQLQALCPHCKGKLQERGGGDWPSALYCKRCNHLSDAVPPGVNIHQEALDEIARRAETEEWKNRDMTPPPVNSPTYSR